MADTTQLHVDPLTSVRSCVLLDESQGGISCFRPNLSALLTSAVNSIFSVNAKPTIVPGIDQATEDNKIDLA